MSTAPPVQRDKPGGPRSRRGVQTRTRLVEAAKAVFEEHGFREATVSDIADRAGLSHGSFYHYFESKDEAFLEVVEARESSFGANSAVDSGLLVDPVSPGHIRDRLHDALGAYLADYRDEARLMGLIEQVSRYHEPVRSMRVEREHHFALRTQDAIGRLQAEGLADPELDPNVAASALIAMITRFAEMWLAQGTVETDFDQAVDQLTAICMNALQLKDPPAAPSV